MPRTSWLFIFGRAKNCGRYSRLDVSTNSVSDDLAVISRPKSFLLVHPESFSMCFQSFSPGQSFKSRLWWSWASSACLVHPDRTLGTFRLMTQAVRMELRMNRQRRSKVQCRSVELRMCRLLLHAPCSSNKEEYSGNSGNVAVKIV